MYSNIDEAWKSSNDLDKYRKQFKPTNSVRDATNEIKLNSPSSSPKFEIDSSIKLETERSEKSVASSAIFETEIRDLKKLIHKDDGKQCDRLFSHFQTCQKCRNKIIEKFSLNTEKPTEHPIRYTESFVDFTKYTDLLKNKNYNNILSIILFGLLVIIILSMINNE